jgi:frataxin-like iron-binding protein CyaY
MIDEREFKKHAEEALAALQRDLVLAADDYGFHTHLNEGAITISLDRPSAKITIAIDAAVHQLKVAIGARNYKLDWDIVDNTFVHTDSHQSLKSLLEQAISKHLKQDVEL